MGYCELDHVKMAQQYINQDSDDENEVDFKPKYENTVYLYPEEALFLIENVICPLDIFEFYYLE
jgi:hypothetical protein